MKYGTSCCCFFFSSRRRHTRFDCDWSSDVCSSDLTGSLQANYRPLSWLEAHAVIGTDFLSRYDENTTFPGIIPASFNPSANQGNRRSEERRVGKECRSRWSPYH